MDHETLKQIIFDQHEVIKKSQIVSRDYVFDKNANYVLIGLRRSGKSTLLYKRVQDLVSSGVDWKQIIYINFDDERLLGFQASDFEDILLTAEEITSQKHYFYFDEIQNIDGWEKFAIRMANAKEKVDITGSNAKMLSHEVSAKLGGRYLTKIIHPYSFKEFLRAKSLEASSAFSVSDRAEIANALREFYRFGGFPESLASVDKREYVSNIYEKILLGDIITRNAIRSENGMRVLMKKIAGTISQDVSYTNLYHALKTIGFSLSKDTIIDYCFYANQSFLLFTLKNYYAAFVDKESKPKFYFSDNGILNLFLAQDDTSLFENLVAVSLKQRYQDKLYYLKSSKAKIDIDFLVDEENIAVQACYSMANTETANREVGQLKKLDAKNPGKYKLMIITMNETGNIPLEHNVIRIIKLQDFLFSN